MTDTHKAFAVIALAIGIPMYILALPYVPYVLGMVK